MEYGAYEIETEKEPAGKWRAYIRRRDGKPIPYGSADLQVLSTMRFDSEEAAINEAKATIDRGHMK